MRIALVVQRYGEEVAGGAELHARYVAELLQRRHEVRVLTTTALDYLSWRGHYPAGTAQVGGIEVLRFAVERERDDKRFAAAAAAAFAPGHSRDDEERYLAEQGPWAPSLWRHLAEERQRYDAVVAFSYRYVTTREAVRVMPGRTLLVPTAESDPAIRLGVAHELFRSVGAIAYNTPEERTLIQGASGNESVPGDEVGIFSRIPEKPSAARFRNRHGIDGPYVLYVGRIDRNKGCGELFEHFSSFVAETALPHRLVLIGVEVLPVPPHPRFTHLGFLSDEDKFDALAGADALLVPSPYESLSMVTLEAMALGAPPLVNGSCHVLRGQVLRANAGLYYEGYDELFEALYLLLTTPRLRAILGRNGEAWYRRTYDPEVIAEKYERLLRALGSGA